MDFTFDGVSFDDMFQQTPPQPVVNVVAEQTASIGQKAKQLTQQSAQKAKVLSKATATPVNQQPVQNTFTGSLDKLMNKTDYSEQEWDEREAIYVAACNKIKIDAANLNTSTISVAASQIEALLTPLRIDNIYAQRKATRYDTQIKLQKELLYNAVKNNSGQKLTIDEVKSIIANKINSTKWDNTQYNLNELFSIYNGRYIFTSGLIEALKDKKDLLITYSGMLKIENNVGNFQQSVPTNTQFNQMRG